MNKAKMLNDIELYKAGDIAKEDVEQSLNEYIKSQNSGKPIVSRSACDCGVPLVREKHSDLMFGDRYFDIEGYYCPKCGELHSVDEF